LDYNVSMATEYVIDGSRITSLEAFYDEISRVLIPGHQWGGISALLGWANPAARLCRANSDVTSSCARATAFQTANRVFTTTVLCPSIVLVFTGGGPADRSTIPPFPHCARQAAPSVCDTGIA
jgi:hypothetical protein